METVKKPVVSLFVIRTSPHWIVQDPDGNFWLVPSGEEGWEQRQPFYPDEEIELEPVPRHYISMLGLPF